MPPQYHIEDIIEQDASAVVYLALEQTSGQWVALQRFLPIHNDGQGLTPAEQAAFQQAVTTLTTMHHPSLAPILASGCDPVDGIPYIVSAWIDAPTLAEMASDEEPEPELAVRWLMQALEVSELISFALSRSSIWIDPHPAAVRLVPDGDFYLACYRIAPAPCASPYHHPTLVPIIRLTEAIMGWQGKVVSDHAAKGLGSWLNWLRAADPSTPLQEVREMLAASVGAEPPPPTSKLVHCATAASPSKPLHRRHIQLAGASSETRWPAIAVILLLVATSCLGAWIYFRPSAPATSAPLSAPSQPTPAKPSDPEGPLPEPSSPSHTTADAAASGSPTTASGPVYTLHDRATLMQKKGQLVTFEGVLLTIETTSTRGLLLHFSHPSKKTAPRGYISAKNAVGGLSQAAVKKLQGKRIQLQGTVSTRHGRPDMEIDHPQSLLVVE